MAVLCNGMETALFQYAGESFRQAGASNCLDGGSHVIFHTAVFDPGRPTQFGQNVSCPGVAIFGLADGTSVDKVCPADLLPVGKMGVPKENHVHFPCLSSRSLTFRSIWSRISRNFSRVSS